MRFILSIIRAVPEIILAIALMLAILGLGPLAGALALGFSSSGTLSKLFSESIEAVDEGSLEPANAAGANKTQMIRWAVLPQVMSKVIAIWLYRFEIMKRLSSPGRRAPNPQPLPLCLMQAQRHAYLKSLDED